MPRSCVFRPALTPQLKDRSNTFQMKPSYPCTSIKDGVRQSSIHVSALRADDYSPDGKNVIISLTTSYSTADRKYSVPVECFHDLIVDLQRLNAAASASSIQTPIQPAVAQNPADDLNRLKIAV